MWIKTEVADGYVRVELFGRITTPDVEAPVGRVLGLSEQETSAEPITDTINAFLDEGHRQFVVNLDRVSSMDSGAASDLVKAYTTASRRGGTLKIEGIPPSISALRSFIR
jgi:ABC-type transporter Mla MlaB component